VTRHLLLLLPAAIACAQILSWDEYRATGYRTGGVLRLESADGHLLYFGARHTRDSKDPQVEGIARLWREFGPTIALIEGGVPPAAESEREAVGLYGEPGLVRMLADRERVPARSLDPSREDQVTALLRTFPSDRVKLFFLLRTVGDFRKHPRGGAALPDFAAGELARLSRTPGLGGAPRSLRDVELAVPGWRDVPGSWFDPLRSESFTNEITRELSQFRNRHMVQLLVSQVTAGQRVFAVVGQTHVAMQERALRQALAGGR
jgi:hypothetical protein